MLSVRTTKNDMTATIMNPINSQICGNSFDVLNPPVSRVLLNFLKSLINSSHLLTIEDRKYRFSMSYPWFKQFQNFRSSNSKQSHSGIERSWESGSQATPPSLQMCNYTPARKKMTMRCAYSVLGN